MSVDAFVELLTRASTWPLPLPEGTALFLSDSMGHPTLALPVDAALPPGLHSLIEEAQATGRIAGSEGYPPVRVAVVGAPRDCTAVTITGPLAPILCAPVAAFLQAIFAQEVEMEIAASQMQDLYDQVTFLLNTSASVNNAGTVTGQLQALLRAAVELLEVEGGIVLPAEGHELVTCGASWLGPLAPELWQALCAHGEVLLLNDAAACDAFCPGLEGRADSLAGAAGPVDDEVSVGVLVVNKRTGGFRAADRQLANFFAEQMQAVARRDRLAAARTAERLQAHEMELARQMYEAIVPRALPHLLSTDLAVLSRPASDLGGDFHLVTELPDGRLLLLVGDAAGKGLPAALLMSQASASLRALASCGEGHPARLLERAEALLRDVLNNTELFVTLFVGMLDIRTGCMHYADAGHGYALHRHAGSGEVVALPATGAPFGVLALSGIGEGETRLAQGDMLVICSDGVIELPSAQGEQFGLDRLRGFLAFAEAASAQEFVETLASALRKYTARDDGLSPIGQVDDITALVAMYRPGRAPGHNAAIPPACLTAPLDTSTLSTQECEVCGPGAVPTRQATRRFEGTREQIGAFTQWMQGVGLAVPAWHAGRAYDLTLASEECFTNVVKHAYEDAGQHGPIDVRVTSQGDQILVSLVDVGAPLDRPDIVAMPTLPDPEWLLEGGYGLYLMQQLAEDVSYEAVPGGNTWQLRFRL